MLEQQLATSMHTCQKLYSTMLEQELVRKRKYKTQFTNNEHNIYLQVWSSVYIMWMHYIYSFCGSMCFPRYLILMMLNKLKSNHKYHQAKKEMWNKSKNNKVFGDSHKNNQKLKNFTKI